MDYARELGCNRVTTCTLNEGHDNPFELEYRDAFAEEAFAAICEHDPATRVFIEYKWGGPRARFSFQGLGCAPMVASRRERQKTPGV